MRSRTTRRAFLAGTAAFAATPMLPATAFIGPLPTRAYLEHIQRIQHEVSKAIAIGAFEIDAPVN